MNKTFITAIMTGMLALSGTAVAQTENDQDIKSDVNAINKDNAAIQRHETDLQQHREQKADDKANDNYGSQAVDSTKIGADKTAISEKKMERSADQKILAHHKKKMKKENTSSSDMSSTENQ